jgi:hypothetical protein
MVKMRIIMEILQTDEWRCEFSKCSDGKNDEESR